MYDDDWRNDLRFMLNAKTVEISGRRLGQALGFKETRFLDGYEVFTPPESAYDPVKVRAKLWGKGANSVEPVVPAYAASAEERARWQYPALARLDEIATKFAGRVVFIYVPAHIAPAGRLCNGARRKCKTRIGAIARRHGRPSSFNIPPDHGERYSGGTAAFRLVAERVVDDIEQAATGRTIRGRLALLDITGRFPQPWGVAPGRTRPCQTWMDYCVTCCS
jgi:hypothetical protein